MGSPSEFRIGVDCGIKPLAAAGTWCRSSGSCDTWLRLSIRSMDAGAAVSLRLHVTVRSEYTDLLGDREASGRMTWCASLTSNSAHL